MTHIYTCRQFCFQWRKDQKTHTGRKKTNLLLLPLETDIFQLLFYSCSSLHRWEASFATLTDNRLNVIKSWVFVQACFPCSVYSPRYSRPREAVTDDPLDNHGDLTPSHRINNGRINNVQGVSVSWGKKKNVNISGWKSVFKEFNGSTFWMWAVYFLKRDVIRKKSERGVKRGLFRARVTWRWLTGVLVELVQCCSSAAVDRLPKW